MAVSNLTLIVGGPGSGKTSEVVLRLAARYEADPFAETVVLVPTVRHGDQLRRRLVGRCGVALRLRVETIPQFSRQLAAAARVSRPPHPRHSRAGGNPSPAGKLRVPSYTLAGELLARTARREVERGPAAYFRPIAGTVGFNDLLSDSVDDLLAEAVDPRALSESAARSGSPALTALSAIFAAYAAELERRDWRHPAQIALAAAGALHHGAAPPPAVMLDGFHLFRGSELVLLQALADRSEVAAALDPGAGARARYDYERLLSLFPNAELVEIRPPREEEPSPLPRQGELFPLLQPYGGRGRWGLPPTVTAGEAADREAQVRAIARQIKQRLTGQPSLRPSDCAVAFRQVSPYLSLARQVFEEYDLPLDPAAGERLSARPLGVWLRRLLRLAQDGWRLRDVAAVLSSGFVDLDRWGLSRGLVALFARRGREAHLWAGRDRLGRIVEALHSEADAETASEPRRDMLRRTADGMAAALDELRALLESGSASAAEHARRLDETLFGERAIVSPGARERAGVTVEIDALRGYLKELASTHEALGGEPELFDSFAARLERLLDAPAVLLREAGGVLLAPMHTLHGLRFDFVAVGGLIEGEFPARRANAGLLDPAAREALGLAGLPMPPEPRLSEDELWASVKTRADGDLALWKSRLDERGRPAAASYYFHSVDHDAAIEDRTTPPEQTASLRELAVACARQWPDRGRLRPRRSKAWPVVRTAVAVEQRRRSFGNAGVYEGRLAAGLVPGLTGVEATWSASRLESYRTCAFQFFSRYALRLRELDEEMDSADAATRGSVIHEVLQDALAPLIEEGRPLTPDTLPDAVRRLREDGPRIWNEAPRKRSFGRAALWRLDAEAVFNQLEMLLEREVETSAQSGVTRIIGAERNIEASLPLDPPLRVTATVDRLDAGDGFVAIVDYKSGREIHRSHVMDARRVQLQLYGYLAREEAKAARVVARYAWTNPAIREWDLDTSREEDARVVDAVVAVADEVRVSVESGDFRVDPQVQPCPAYCAFKHVCRVNELTRWKRWD